MRMVYDSANHPSCVSQDILRQPWDRTKKYELVERRMNSPEGSIRIPKLPANRQLYELSNRMATHYRSFEGTSSSYIVGKLVKLTDQNLYGAVERKQDLPDFPKFRRVAARSRRKH